MYFRTFYGPSCRIVIIGGATYKTVSSAVIRKTRIFNVGQLPSQRSKHPIQVENLFEG